MKRQPILNFFDISSNIEELPENELFKLKGGYSDSYDGGEIDGVDVWGDGGGDDPWGEDDGGDDDVYYDDEYDEDFWEERDNEGDGQENNPDGESNEDNTNQENSSNANQQDVIEQLMNNLAFDANLSEEFKENFKAALEIIKHSDIGKKVLEMIAQNAGNIQITNDDFHATQGNMIHLGIFDQSTEGFQVGYHSNALAHELFHALQNSVYGTTSKDVYYEVEAFLFEYEIASMDKDHLDTFWFKFEEGSFKDAFMDFLTLEEKTVEDFNVLIDNFKDGVRAGGAYDDYIETHIESLEDLVSSGVFNW